MFVTTNLTLPFGAPCVPGKTLNAVLWYAVAGQIFAPGSQVGEILVAVLLLSAGALLFVAAQTGFLGGPRVHRAQPQQAVDHDHARVEREIAGENALDDVLDRHAPDLRHLAILVDGPEVVGKPDVVHEEDLAVQPLGNRILDAHRAKAVEVAEERRGDSRLLPRFLAQRLVHGEARGDAPADEVVEHPGIDRLVGRAARHPRVGEPVAPREAVQVGRIGHEAEVARRRTLDAQHLRCRVVRRDAHHLLAPAADQPFLRQRARDLVERRGAPGGRVGPRLQRDPRRAHLEDVRPALQLGRERRPDPADRLFLHVERQEGELPSDVGGMGAGGLEEATDG
jgi:hypothetical protein